MFDIGWSEMALVAVIALVILGPKELPKTMRMVAHFVRKARAITGEFQSSFNEMVREAELEDAKKALQEANRIDPLKTFTDAVDPTGDVDKSLSDVDKEAKAEPDTTSAPKGQPLPGGKPKTAAANGEAKEAPANAASAPEAAPEPAQAEAAPGDPAATQKSA